MRPTLEVEVAEPEMFKPASVVVPKPVAETERKVVFVVPELLVEEATENTFDPLVPYIF